MFEDTDQTADDFGMMFGAVVRLLCEMDDQDLSERLRGICQQCGMQEDRVRFCVVSYQLARGICLRRQKR